MSNLTRNPVHERYLELLAGESIDDLSPQEAAELAALRLRIPPITDAQGRVPTPDQADAALGATVLAGLKVRPAPLTAGFKARLQAQGEAIVAGSQSATALSRTEPTRTTVTPFSRAFRPLVWGGWAASAAVLLLALWLWTPRPTVTPQARLLAFIRDTTGTQRVPLQSRHHPTALSLNAEVIWNPTTQSGYLRVSGLPVNDPAREQYQLWIADAARAGIQPVSGGVFNASDGFALADTTDLYIPFKPDLPVTRAATFALTLERPGGVVRTDLTRLLADGDIPLPRDPSLPVKDHWPPR